MDSSRPLCDAPDRSYVEKLERFARFAKPELEQVFDSFSLRPGASALDLGCGAGLTTAWLARRVGPAGIALGADLSRPHLLAARSYHDALLQMDASRPCFREATFDFLWSCNTLNHVAEPAGALRRLSALLKPGGVLAVAQSGFLPDMFFAWDAPLEDAVRTACHRYYRERYGLALGDTAGVRGLLGQTRAAGLANIAARTWVIERIQPLTSADRDYFRQAIFQGVWGEKIHPFLRPDEVDKLQRYCEPSSPDYCLDRDDFHHIQTLTVCTGSRQG